MIADIGYSHADKPQISVCKPDYESLIQSDKTRLIKVANFLDAALTYIGDNLAHDKLAELIGELYTQKRSIKLSIERNIELQEKEG